MVTAEAAMVVPALVGLVALLLWGVASGMLLLQCGDAARAGARAVARGETAETARGLASQVAPEGAVVEITEDSGLHRVRVTTLSPGPGLLSLPLGAEGVAHVEP